MDLYFERHDGQAVTCDDFVQAMQDASGLDLTQFKRWYSQAGTPVVRLAGRVRRGGTTYTLEVAQEASPLARPAREGAVPHPARRSGLLGARRRRHSAARRRRSRRRPTTRVLDVRSRARSYSASPDVPSPPVPSLLRGFSAPVRLDFPYSDRELAFLAAHDSDPVNRWDAAQRTFVTALLWLARERRAGKPLALPAALEQVVAQLLVGREERSGAASRWR